MLQISESLFVVLCQSKQSEELLLISSPVVISYAYSGITEEYAYKRVYEL